MSELGFPGLVDRASLFTQLLGEFQELSVDDVDTFQRREIEHAIAAFECGQELVQVQDDVRTQFERELVEGSDLGAVAAQFRDQVSGGAG